jgi:hypothetical protein
LKEQQHIVEILSKLRENKGGRGILGRSNSIFSLWSDRVRIIIYHIMKRYRYSIDM